MRTIDQIDALQHIDTELDAARKRYAEIQQALQPPESLKNAAMQRDTIAASLEHWRGERKQRDIAVDEQSTRIKTQEQQLYGGYVKDPREQVAVQQNIESLQKHLDTVEELSLEAMLEFEQAEADLSEAESVLAAEQATWQQQEAELQQERQTLITRARTLKAKRDQAASRLDVGILKQYESLRQVSGGAAVAELRGASCGGCGAALPTAVRQQAHGDALVACPICRRWLRSP